MIRLYVLLMSDDLEGIHSRDQGQPRTSPPAHLNLAGIVHELDRPDVSGLQVAPFVLHVNQFDRIKPDRRESLKWGLIGNG